MPQVAAALGPEWAGTSKHTLCRADLLLPAKGLRCAQLSPRTAWLGLFSFPGEPASGKQEGQCETTVKGQPLFGPPWDDGLTHASFHTLTPSAHHINF